MFQAIAKFFLFNVLKWKVVGGFPKDIKKYVLIGVPHTSNFDFIIGLLLKLALKVPINFLGKKSLFKFPFGSFFKAVGGIPVDRKKNEKMVDAITRIFKEKDQFVFAISPEGTRSKVTDWKTGFYYIASQAKVPIVGLTFDYKNKQTEVFEPFIPTGDIEADFKFLKSRYKNIVGKVPKNSFDVVD